MVRQGAIWPVPKFRVIAIGALLFLSMLLMLGCSLSSHFRHSCYERCEKLHQEQFLLDRCKNDCDERFPHKLDEQYRWPNLKSNP